MLRCATDVYLKKGLPFYHDRYGFGVLGVYIGKGQIFGFVGNDVYILDINDLKVSWFLVDDVFLKYLKRNKKGF